MQTQFVVSILLSLILSACSSATQTPFSTETLQLIIEPTLTKLPAVSQENEEDEKAFASKPPPPALLKTQSAEQMSAIGTYCWSGECADMIGIPTPKEAIVANQQFSATLKLPINAPPASLKIRVNPTSQIDEYKAGSNYRWWEAWQGEYNSLALEKEQTINLELEQGLYVISVLAQWNQSGDVIYGFLVEVK
jgi:hypothetical protein